MELPFARIAAFIGSTPLSGNTASVVRLQTMLPDDVLLALAFRNGDSETAYLLESGEGRWQLRWFTPGVEVDLCGHATLAAGHHLQEHRLDDVVAVAHVLQALVELVHDLSLGALLARSLRLRRQ